MSYFLSKEESNFYEDEGYLVRENQFSINEVNALRHALEIPLTEEGVDKGGGFLLLLKLWSLNSPLFLKRQHTELLLVLLQAILHSKGEIESSISKPYKFIPALQR